MATAPTAAAVLLPLNLSAAAPVEATQHFLAALFTAAAEPIWKLLMLYRAS